MKVKDCGASGEYFCSANMYCYGPGIVHGDVPHSVVVHGMENISERTAFDLKNFRAPHFSMALQENYVCVYAIKRESKSAHRRNDCCLNSSLPS